MKKIKEVLMSITIIAMVATFASCSPTDIVNEMVGKDEFFITCDSVTTNLISSETGEELSSALYEAFEFEGGGKVFEMGYAYEHEAWEVFSTSCTNLRSSLNEMWKGKLPQGGWIEYYFSLRKDKASGEVVKSSSVTVQ